MGSGIVLIEKISVSNSMIDRQDMRVSDFIHIALVCNCAPNYNQVGKVKYAKLTDHYITLLYNAQVGLLFF